MESEIRVGLSKDKCSIVCITDKKNLKDSFIKAKKMLQESEL
jgi:hypothetical protein